MRYKLFCLAFAVWLVSLMVVYSPLIELTVPTFPTPIEYRYRLTAFLASTAISSLSSIYIGITEFRRAKTMPLKE